MQARARVLMDSSVPTLRRQQGQDTSTAPDRVVALYASALASLQLGEPARARAAVEAALPLARSSAATDLRAAQALALLHAQTLQASGQAERASQLLATLPAPTPPGSVRPVLLARAQAALDTARSGGSATALRDHTESLQTWVAEHRADSGAWALLAQCADSLGLRLRALRAEAEARAALGDASGAMDRLRAAQRLARNSTAPPDFIEASIIDTRLRELTAQRRAQLAEARGERARQEPPQ